MGEKNSLVAGIIDVCSKPCLAGFWVVVRGGLRSATRHRLGGTRPCAAPGWLRLQCTRIYDMAASWWLQENDDVYVDIDCAIYYYMPIIAWPSLRR